MTTGRMKLYPSAPIKKIDLEHKIGEKLNDVKSFNTSIINLREMISYFKDKNNIAKKKYKKYKMLTRTLKSFDTLVIFATTSSSFTLPLTRIGLICTPEWTAIA